ncbi:porin family protein [Olleya sp. R77988]|uniref:porin family protein n=1 Tax=Olleya sp. R77988 TaxID=3093875 RepID=UPI0037CA7F99
MKKLLMIAAVAVFGLSSVNAQNAQFGLTAGYLSATGSAESGGISISATESGFYIGGVADIEISDVFHVQPEVVYASTGDDGGDGIAIPIMAKYYVSDKFNIQAGPHFDISLEDIPEDFTGFGISLGAGLGYDIDDNFFAEARYSFQLNDYYTGDLDVSTTTNLLMVGVGYKFN